MATAIIEFVIAGYIFLKYQKSLFAKFVALFIFILGFYQFTEFMICTTGEVQLWGKLGFITYTFLPAAGFHFVLSYTNKFFRKSFFKKFIIYLPVIIFILIALLDPNFVLSGSCGKLFVSVKNYFHDLAGNPVSTFLYWLYYFGYVASICIYLIYGIKKEKNKNRILVYLLMLVTTLLVIFPPLLLIFIFPVFNHQFPSIYCQFALIYSVLAVIGVYLNNKFEISKWEKIKRLIKKIIK
ncbi:MAG: hypothetical protein HQ538_00895 [Parcubacteria group bacterium]|nr:hypothetical protein [Parcubacteria group bacterium]